MLRLCGRVFAVINDVVGFFACRNTHDADSIADHIGGALLAFRSGGHFGYNPNSSSVRCFGDMGRASGGQKNVHRARQLLHLWHH